MYLVFDIESTGLVQCNEFNLYPDFRDVSKYDSARIIQVAWVVLDITFTVIEKKSYIIKRDNFNITNDEFHGISNEISDIQGIDFELAMLDFFTALHKCDMIISHNILFDFNVLANHLYRYDLYDIFYEFNQKLRFCTSFESQMVLKLPMPYKCFIYKLPSLQELYTFYFNKEIDNAHDALSDSIACADCFVLLIQDDRFKNQHRDQNKDPNTNKKTKKTEQKTKKIKKQKSKTWTIQQTVQPT